MPIKDTRDCCFEREDNRFRYRVGAIIVEDGCVLLAKNEVCSYYYSIGGGVHLGESSADAVRREVKEETGIDYEPDRVVLIHENFFEDKEGALKGLQCHEVSIYYLMKSRGKTNISVSSICLDGVEHAEWVPLDKISDGKYNGRKIYPAFYCDRLKDLVNSNTLEHLITRD